MADKPAIPFPLSTLGAVPPEFAGATLINTEPYEVAGWMPLTTMMCRCKEGHIQLVYMLGVGVPGMCPLCYRVFTATGISPDGQILVSVQKGTPR